MPTDFASLALRPPLLEVVAELGFTAPTPIQAACIPPLLAGQDLLGQSKTGSGKTAAFALPILERLSPTERALSALILCPTRELSAQVARELRTLGRRLPGLEVLLVSGGQPLNPQIEALARVPHLLVGTPGRVQDLLEREALDPRGITTVVLDEADRMLDMGFEESIRAILDALPKQRQTVLLSATYPKSIEAMSRRYLKDPARVTIEAEAAPLLIDQLVAHVREDEREDALIAALAANPHESAIIFCNQKATVKALAAKLAEARASVLCLHGDLEQRDRDRVMAQFRNQSARLLVATDVAARGLDVADLDLVINYDLPTRLDDYVHRIGRTGRADKAGVALSICVTRDAERLAAIEAHTGTALERVKLALAPADRTRARRLLNRPAKMRTLYITGGRKDKLRPGDLLGALCGDAGGLKAAQVGGIEIHDHFSYVAVHADIAREAAGALSRGRIKGRRFRAGLAD